MNDDLEIVIGDSELNDVEHLIHDVPSKETKREMLNIISEMVLSLPEGVGGSGHGFSFIPLGHCGFFMRH